MWLALTVALRSKREAEKVCLSGVSEAYCLERFSLHLHVKWPGCDTAGEWKAGNDWRVPEQCYVTSFFCLSQPSCASSTGETCSETCIPSLQTMCAQFI